MRTFLLKAPSGTLLLAVWLATLSSLACAVEPLPDNAAELRVDPAPLPSDATMPPAPAVADLEASEVWPAADGQEASDVQEVSNIQQAGANPATEVAPGDL